MGRIPNVHATLNAAVLITGAGRGIGKRLSLGMARAGARVGLLGRSQGEIDSTKLEIEHSGGTALRLRADVRNYEQMSAAVERMTSTWGLVDTLIANAAVQGPVGGFDTNRPGDWQEVFETNVIGVMNSCRAVLPQMIQRRSGKILIVVGQGSAAPRPGFAPFAASAAAVVRFCESVAEEVREHNVQVNCMFPGETYTSMTDEVIRAGERAGLRELEDAERVQATGGVGAEKQIQLAIFLASQRSNHVTGKLVYITDDLKKFEHENNRPDAFTLRRNLK